MSKYAKAFRDALNAALEKRGAQEELREKLGLKGRSGLAGIRDGTNVPRLDTAERIAAALGMSLPEMLGEPAPKIVEDHGIMECYRRVGEAVARDWARRAEAGEFDGGVPGDTPDSDEADAEAPPAPIRK